MCEKMFAHASLTSYKKNMKREAYILVCPFLNNIICQEIICYMVYVYVYAY